MYPKLYKLEKRQFKVPEADNGMHGRAGRMIKAIQHCTRSLAAYQSLYAGKPPLILTIHYRNIGCLPGHQGLAAAL